MWRIFASLRAWAASLLLALVLTGCAGVALDGRQLDVEGLNNAIVSDNLDYFKSAVQAGTIDINQRISVPGYLEGTPVITLAAKHAALDILQYLIRAGADINAFTPVNETPVMLAAFFYEEGRDNATHSYDRHEKAVRMLVAAGAYLENGEFDYTPLAYAAYQGHDRIVNFLLERGARVDADARDGRSYVNTPLMMAAIQGHRRTTDSLLRAGANPRVRGYHGQTAAELAVKHKHINVFQLLKCAENAAPGEAFTRGCR